MTGTWSLGVLIGLPVAFLVVVALIAASRYTAHKSRTLTGRYVDDDRKLLKSISRVLLAIIVIPVGITAFAMWPYSAQYHRWEPKRFVVQEVNRRLISDGDHSMNQRIAARAEGGEVYGCDDTRCSLVKPGDVLILLCKREYQWSGVSGWSCNFGRVIRRG